MKTYLLLSFLFLGARLLALVPHSSKPLFQYLVEVNRNWLSHTPDQALLENAAFATDRERIQKHLELVENELRTSDVSWLSCVQKANRLRHLDVLHDYRQTGIFPTNHYHTTRQPYFRDNSGVLCAVGFLMWKDGQYEAVNRINRENNYAYIAVLAGQYPELGTWAQDNGFTLEELALIQPAYEPIKPDLQTWGNGGGLNPGGRINVMTKDDAETRLFAAGSFSEIDGFAANNIAVWDGTTWSTLGDGVVGEIFALGYQKTWNAEKLYVAGDFYLPGQPTKRNVAEYDLLTQTWKGLQTGDMEGAVRALVVQYTRVFIGGDFQKVNETSIPYFARYNSYNNTWDTPSNNLTMDGPVYALCDVDGLLLVGGAFQKVFPGEDGNWLESPHLTYHAYWDYWTPLYNSLPTPVRALAFNGGNVYTGHKIEPAGTQSFEVTPALNVLQAGFWHLNDIYPKYDSLVHGFVRIGENLVAYGGFFAGEFTYGIGMATFYEDATKPYGFLISDSTVRSALHFKNFVYLSGDFQNLWDEAFPGMARIYAPVVAAKEPTAAILVQVTTTFDRLLLRYESLPETTQLTVYDLNGRLLARQTLRPGDGETTLDANIGWANGLYVWHLHNAAGMRVGKWAVTR